MGWNTVCYSHYYQPAFRNRTFETTYEDNDQLGRRSLENDDPLGIKSARWSRRLCTSVDRRRSCRGRSRAGRERYRRWRSGRADLLGLSCWRLSSGRALLPSRRANARIGSGRAMRVRVLVGEARHLGTRQELHEAEHCTTVYSSLLVSTLLLFRSRAPEQSDYCREWIAQVKGVGGEPRDVGVSLGRGCDAFAPSSLSAGLTHAATSALSHVTYALTRHVMQSSE